MDGRRKVDMRDLAARVERLESWFVTALIALVGLLAEVFTLLAVLFAQ